MGVAIWRHIKSYLELSCGRSSSYGCSSKAQEKDKMITGTDLIKKYEGFRADAYKCPAGVWTIGYGSTTYADGTPVKKGDKISQSTAESLLEDYLIKNIRKNLVGLSLNDGQMAALESLIYNIGWGAFSKSKCYKALKEKDWETFYNQYDWVKGGGKFLLGLAKRRAEELYWFFKDL